MRNDNGNKPTASLRKRQLSKIPKPYSLLFHPFLTLFEKFVSKMIDLVGGLYGLSINEPGTQGCEDALAKYRNNWDSMGKYVIRKWSKASSPESSPSPLAEASGKIPFRPNILREWKIVDEDTVLPKAASSAKDREGVPVLIRFPSSLLPAEIRDHATVLDYSECLGVAFDAIDWRTFAPEVPLQVQFHGGALVIGAPHDSNLLQETVRLVENAPEGASNDLITISVDYALAPEHPFPVGVMDALSVVDYFLNTTNPRRSFHIMGMSAGANMALVAGLEGVRRFPGQISSIEAQSPFVDPAADTAGYYMNQNVYPDNQFLRWSWRAYLGLAKPTPDDANSASEWDNALRKGSNHTSWKTWKANFPSPALHRLVNPALGVPDGLRGEKAPTIIMRYNKGDPLHDDGKMVREALEAKTGDNARFAEEDHIHCDLLGYCASTPLDYWKVWSGAVFGHTMSGPTQ